MQRKRLGWMGKQFALPSHIPVGWRNMPLRLFVFFTGLWFLALGAVFTIKARLGVPTWEVLHIGLANVIGFTIGTWVVLVGVAILSVVCWFRRSLPKWGTVLNMIFVGVFIDLILFFHLVPDVQSLWLRWVFFFTGMIVLALGGGLYIAPKAGEGPRDGLTLELSKRTGWSIQRIRTIMEISVGGIGWMLGGPIHIGTLFFCLLTGPLMQFSIIQCERFYQRLSKRGGHIENIDKRTVWTHHHDGSGY